MAGIGSQKVRGPMIPRRLGGLVRLARVLRYLTDQLWALSKEWNIGVLELASVTGWIGRTEN